MENLKDTEKFVVYKKDEDLPEYISKLVSWIERMIFNRISKRVNWVLSIISEDSNNNITISSDGTIRLAPSGITNDYLEISSDGSTITFSSLVTEFLFAPGEPAITINADVIVDGAFEVMQLLVRGTDYLVEIATDGTPRIRATGGQDFRIVQAASADLTIEGFTGKQIILKRANVVFEGAAALTFGSFWGNEIGFVVAGGTGTYKDIFDGDITTGKLNNVTHNTTGENTLDIGATAGMYLVNWSMSVKGTGANKHLIGAIGVDAGGVSGSLTAQNDGRNHAITMGNAELSLSGTAILDLSANSEVGLMVTNETDNSNVTVEHVSLSIVQIGGT